MIEGKHKRKHEDYQRSSLYIIESDETIEYSDKSGDSATIVYQIKDGQHGLYANEFRPAQVPKQGSKINDLRYWSKKQGRFIPSEKGIRFFEKFIEKKFVYLDPDGKEEIWDFEVISYSHHVFMWTLETSMA